MQYKKERVEDIDVEELKVCKEKNLKRQNKEYLRMYKRRVNDTKGRIKGREKKELKI